VNWHEAVRPRRRKFTEEDEYFDADMLPPINTHKLAVESLEDFKVFFENHNNLELASNATYITAM